MSYIAVIGAGSWGTTLACLIAEKGYNTSLWVYEKDLCLEMRETRVNSVYLPGIPVPDNVVITNDIEESVRDAGFILNVVPTQYVRKVLAEAVPFINARAVIISASKGIERKTLLTVSSIIKELTRQRITVLSGPCFALEVARRLPTAVTLSSEDNSISHILQEILTTGYFRVYTHDDILGVELGGALKNVIAIASGICDGLELGNNARASLITRGLAEITRLGTAMGARKQTFSGLSGLGDLILTCTGALSRNYSFGRGLGQGMKPDDILSRTKSAVEGVATSESAYELTKRYNIQMPIVEQVYNVIYKGKDPALAVEELMNRGLKTEFYA
jgi:glycerol-3-phosphate dehydrogenase (NAD(P)+)